MITSAKRLEVLSLISKIENSMSLSHSATSIADSCERLIKSTDAVAPVLRTALVINWKESMMKQRYERFVKMFPEISSLSELKKILDDTPPLEFCKTYLDINANPSTPENNPKYRLLKELTDGFLEYQKIHSLSSEIEALRHWALNVDLCYLKSDPIGKRHGVGPGVVENIRLNLGYSVIKPDRHVIGVMQKVLQVNIPVDGYNKFAEEIGINARYLDYLLFEYGKAQNISG